MGKGVMGLHRGNGELSAKSVPIIGANDPLRSVENFQCRMDYILRKEYKRGKTAGGLDLPDDYQDNSPALAEVVSVGPGVHTQTGEFIPTELKPGDVVFMSYRGKIAPIELGGETYVLCQEGQICGIAKKAK